MIIGVPEIYKYTYLCRNIGLSTFRLFVSSSKYYKDIGYTYIVLKLDQSKIQGSPLTHVHTSFT